MAVYEALLLNTAVPQIQAAQAGDSYVMVVNATTPALRITQTGTGNALEVEDSANPDATPFVVSAAGDVGIGTNAPPTKLYVTASVASTAIAAFFNTDTANGNGVYIKAGGANAGKYALAVDNAASASLLYLDASGNLGLGVTPTANYGGLQVVGPTSANILSQLGIDAIRAGVRSSGNTAIVLDSSNTTYTNRMWYLYNSGAAGSLIIGRPNLDVATFDNSGNLGIGTTSPFGTAANRICLSVNGTTSASINAGSGGVQRVYLFGSASVGQIGTIGGLPLAFAPNDTEKARIDSDGTFRVKGAGTAGTTDAFQVAGTAPADAARIDSSGYFDVDCTATPDGTTRRGFQVVANTGVNDTTKILIATTSTSTRALAEFNNGNGNVGSISVTGSATAYNTSSDYRLKDNPQPLTNSGAFIDALKPKTWDWKSDGSKGVGFIAHEVQEVSPGTVVGEKDGEQMQAMEYGSAEFIANIVAELQSLRARVAQLEAK
jgi:hypothetical protein